MNFKDLLNTDHQAIIQWLLHGFRWWVDELMAMVPPAWRDRLLRRNLAVAELADNGIVYRRAQSGERLPEKPRGSVKLALDPNEVLVREIELPILPTSDIKRMVALDLDRLTPFRPDQVVFDTEVVARDDANGRQKLLLGILPRAVAARVLERARGFGLQPAAVGLAASSGPGASFDFLPVIRDMDGGGGARRRASYWWIAVGVLMAFNLFMLNYRDAGATAQLRDAVESQQGPVSVAMRLRDKVQKEAARRADLLKKMKQNAPLPVIEAVTQALPDGTWVERFEWDGKTVHIRGFRKGAPNLLASLEASPVLRNARSMSSDPRAAMAGSGGFELAADREMGTSK